MITWERSKNAILNGNSLLSKSPDSILPGLWPSHFERAKGCHVETTGGHRYLDFSNMGVGSCILGYAIDEIDQAVGEVINKGVMSSLNCAEEVDLAETLLRIDSWAGKVRFARTGGEALSIAVRLARAATNRSKIIISGYHGWHDWYLAANLKSTDKLNGYLIPGLAPKGVPPELEGLTYVHDLVDLEALRGVLQKRETAAVVMEVARFSGPDRQLLQKIRDICNETLTLLIFDECTSGFRETLGGMHAGSGVSPDLCTYGKAIANGYALTAITMTEKVAQDSAGVFISSTFWTERIGPAAALATISFLNRHKVPDAIRQKGIFLRERLESMFKSEEVNFSIIGLNSLPCFYSEDGSDRVAITKLLLQKDILFSGTVYLSYAHDDEYLEHFIDQMTEAVRTLKTFTPHEKAEFVSHHMPQFRLGRITSR